MNAPLTATGHADHRGTPRVEITHDGEVIAELDLDEADDLAREIDRAITDAQGIAHEVVYGIPALAWQRAHEAWGAQR